MELKIWISNSLFLLGICLCCVTGFTQLQLRLEAQEVQKNTEILLREYQQEQKIQKVEPEIVEAPTEVPIEEPPPIQNEISKAVVLQQYPVMGILQIPVLALKLPVIQEYSETALKISVCRYDGTEQGNLVISGHNYVNGVHFGTLKKISIGDAVRFFDKNGTEIKYQVVEKEVVAATDMKSVKKNIANQMLTLFTCTDDGSERLVVRCQVVK